MTPAERALLLAVARSTSQYEIFHCNRNNGLDIRALISAVEKEDMLKPPERLTHGVGIGYAVQPTSMAPVKADCETCKYADSPIDGYCVYSGCLAAGTYVNPGWQPRDTKEGETS